MANFELPADEVAVVPILVDDAAGTPVPAPPGDVFSAVSSNPTGLAVAIDLVTLVPAGTPGLRLTPLVPLSTAPVTVTVSDSAGLTTATMMVDIVADTTPKAITLDVAHAVMIPQAEPVAPPA